MIIYVLLFILILLVFYFIKTYNQFVVLRNRVLDQEAQIDVQLKRRYDLIPNLVETAKGYANYESETLEAVVKSRACALQAPNLDSAIAANETLTSALNRLMVVSESYPDLKASGNFMQLQKELAQTEEKIAMARQFYNDTILKYNNSIAVFPDSIIAAATGHLAFSFLKTTEPEREAIKVQF